MRKFFVSFAFVLFWALGVGAQQISSQRVHPTTLNPPTACVRAHLYPNATTHKTYQGTSTGTCTQIDASAASGITNSAPQNTLTKTGPNGTNLVASQISDDGVAVNLGASFAGGIFSIMTGPAFAASSAEVDALTVRLGDGQGNGNGTTLTVDDALSTITVSGTLQATNSKLDGLFPSTAGSTNVGTAPLPYLSLFVGNTANHSTNLTCSTCTANRTSDFPDASGTVQLVGATNTGTILPVDMSNGVLSTATGTVYASPGTTAGLTNATESAVSFPVTRAGTVRNLYIRTGGTAKVNTPATVITIRKNGVDTAVTVTMTQTTSTTSSDTTHSFTVVAGDLITLSFVTTGTAAVSTSIAGVSLEID